MSRTLSAEVQAAIDAATYYPVLLARFEFDGGTERACTTPYSIWFDDEGTAVPNEFIGTGKLGTVSAIEEGSELRSYGISCTLTGVDPAQLALAVDSQYQGRNATIWLGFLNPDHVLLNSPVEVFRGIMDTMPITLGRTGTIRLNIENVLSRWEKPNPRNQRYTSADQQDLYHGDLFLEFTNAATAKELIWGRS